MTRCQSAVCTLSAVLLLQSAVQAGPLVIFIPREFPAVCAIKLEDGSPFCPTGVNTSATDFCDTNVPALHFLAADLGVADCTTPSNIGMSLPNGDTELILLVDDQGMSSELQRLLQPVLKDEGGGKLVRETRGVFRNRASTVVRDTWIVGENRCPQDPGNYCDDKGIGMPEVVGMEPVDTRPMSSLAGAGNDSAGGGMTIGPLVIESGGNDTGTGSTSGDGTRQVRGQSGPSADADRLRPIALEEGYIKFNRAATFDEVARYIWGDNYRPSRSELVARSAHMSTELIDMGLVDTHWQLPQLLRGFVPQAAARMRQEFLREYDALPDITDSREVMMRSRPAWCPEDVWSEMVDLWRAGTETHRRFRGRSVPGQTDIILLTRNGSITGYQEAITDVNKLGTMMRIVPAGTLERLLGESGRQASLRWLAASNRELNAWMQQKVIEEGMSTRQAMRQFQEVQRWKTAQTILEAIGEVLPARLPGGGSMPDALNQELAEAIEALFSSWDYLMDKSGRYDTAERAADPSAPRLD